MLFKLLFLCFKFTFGLCLFSEICPIRSTVCLHSKILVQIPALRMGWSFILTIQRTSFFQAVKLQMPLKPALIRCIKPWSFDFSIYFVFFHQVRPPTAASEYEEATNLSEMDDILEQAPGNFLFSNNNGLDRKCWLNFYSMKTNSHRQNSWIYLLASQKFVNFRQCDYWIFMFRGEVNEKAAGARCYRTEL